MKYINIAILIIFFINCTSNSLQSDNYQYKVVCPSDGINIRTGPGTNYSKDSSGQLFKGENIYVLEEKDGWLRFRVTPGDVGWSSWVLKRLVVSSNNRNSKAKDDDQISMVIDVDKLIGLNIKQMKNILGEPFSEYIPTLEQKRLMPELTPSVEWYFDKLGIYLDYRNNEKIMYIFVLNDGVKYSADEIMKMANLNYNSNRYSLKPQRALNGSGITGIHVYGK